jgi:hypothetical protein
LAGKMMKTSSCSSWFLTASCQQQPTFCKIFISGIVSRQAAVMAIRWRRAAHKPHKDMSFAKKSCKKSVVAGIVELRTSYYNLMFTSFFLPKKQ